MLPPNLELVAAVGAGVAEVWPNGLGPGAACPKVELLVELPNGDGLDAAAPPPNALFDPKVLVPEVDPKGELDAAAGVDPKALLPELDPKGKLEDGAGAAPKGLCKGAATVPKPVGGLDSVFASEEPNGGFIPPTEGREEATPLPNPNDAAGADVADEDDVVG